MIGQCRLKTQPLTIFRELLKIFFLNCCIFPIPQNNISPKNLLEQHNGNRCFVIARKKRNLLDSFRSRL